MPSPIDVFSSRCQQQRRLLISLATNHDDPSHPGDLIGKSNGGDLCGSAAHDPREPEPLGDFAVLVVAPQGKTTVSFRSPVSLARGFFCVLAAFSVSCSAANPIPATLQCLVPADVAIRRQGSSIDCTECSREAFDPKHRFRP